MPAGSLGGRVLVGDLDEDGLPDAVISHLQFIVQPVPQLALGLGDWVASSGVRATVP